MAINWDETMEAVLREAEYTNSHREINPRVFHPSQVNKCKRQCYISKLNLGKNTPIDLGQFRIGTLIHEFLEEYLPRVEDNVIMEMDIEYERDGIKFVGNCDCFHWDEDDTYYVYDFKSRSSLSYRFDPPYDYQIDQLQIYMASIDADYGSIVHLSKKKLVNTDEDKDDWWIEVCPENIELDMDRVDKLTEKAKEIATAIEVKGLPESKEDIPFDKCGCWLCNNENIDDDAFF